MKNINKIDRPRERLINVGPESLSMIELIAILLETGTKTKSVLELSKEVVNSLTNINSLSNISVSELTLISGIKDAKASKIIAAIELGKRLEMEVYEKLVLTDHLDVYKIMNPIMRSFTQEHFYVIFLNKKSVIIDKKCIYIGTIDKTVIHPREIFNQAIKLMSYAIILVHNHPTGDSSPSSADLDVTKILIEASDIIGIQIADHIIMGSNEYYSIKFQKKFLIKKK